MGTMANATDGLRLALNWTTRNLPVLYSRNQPFAGGRMATRLYRRFAAIPEIRAFD
jgi:hypothetical protein